MKIIFQLICFITIFTAQATASARPDNFFMTFDKDIHAFRAKSKRNKDVSNIQPTKVKDDIEPPEEFFDDYDKAENQIFDFVENVEKTVFTAARRIVRHERNTLFSSHKRNRDKMMCLEENQYGERRGSRLPQKDKKTTKKVSTEKDNVVAAPEDKHARISHLNEEYVKGDIE